MELRFLCRSVVLDAFTLNQIYVKF